MSSEESATAVERDDYVEEKLDEDELEMWEIHLCYNLFEESPSDESISLLTPSDWDREQAIEKAREVSKGNPPETGPVYNDRTVDTDHYLHPENQGEEVTYVWWN